MIIYIDGILFPSEALSEMKLIRDTYDRDRSSTIHIDTGIAIPILASIREYMNRYNHIHISIILPRIVPVKDILPMDLLDWMYALSTDDMWRLHMGAYILGYNRLIEVTSLVLSEVLDVPSLLHM